MHALLQIVVSGLGCRHDWSKDVGPGPRRIVCTKCGLYAYVPEHPWGEDRTSTRALESPRREPTAGIGV